MYGKYKYLKPGYYFHLVIDGVVKTWIDVFSTPREAAVARDKVILEKNLKEPLQVLKFKEVNHDKEREVNIQSLPDNRKYDSDDRIQAGL